MGFESGKEKLGWESRSRDNVEWSVFCSLLINSIGSGKRKKERKLIEYDYFNNDNNNNRNINYRNNISAVVGGVICRLLLF